MNKREFFFKIFLVKDKKGHFPGVNYCSCSQKSLLIIMHKLLMYI